MCVLGGSLPARSHHGKDFLLAETYDVPHAGDAYFIFSFDRIAGDKPAEMEASPSFLLGAAPKLG